MPVTPSGIMYDQKSNVMTVIDDIENWAKAAPFYHYKCNRCGFEQEYRVGGGFFSHDEIERISNWKRS